MTIATCTIITIITTVIIFSCMHELVSIIYNAGTVGFVTAKPPQNRIHVFTS